jgi:hypothetical protein
MRDQLLYLWLPALLIGTAVVWFLPRASESAIRWIAGAI